MVTLRSHFPSHFPYQEEPKINLKQTEEQRCNGSLERQVKRHGGGSSAYTPPQSQFVLVFNFLDWGATAPPFFLILGPEALTLDGPKWPIYCGRIIVMRCQFQTLYFMFLILKMIAGLNDVSF
jgi:hypothetical protein